MSHIPWHLIGGLMFKKVAEYGSLVRFSHTLFALPFAIASMWVAADGFKSYKLSEALFQAFLIVAAMFTARSGAMAFNRLVDADLDAINPRTSKRHLPAGKMTKKQVSFFVIVNGLLFIGIASFFNSLALLCALPVFLLLLSYSYWKRFSFLCHWYLGFVIGLSPLGAWVAIRGEFALLPMFLGVILMLWMGGFDIIYATQDQEIDIQTGLHSVPARFGRKKALQIALGSHILMLLAGLVFGFYFALGWIWWVVLLLMSISIFYIHVYRKSEDLDTMNRDFFLANVFISFLVMLGLIIWVIYV